MFGGKRSKPKVDQEQLAKLTKERDSWRQQALDAADEVRSLRAQLEHAHHVVALLVRAVPPETQQLLMRQLFDTGGEQPSPQEVQFKEPVPPRKSISPTIRYRLEDMDTSVLANQTVYMDADADASFIQRPGYGTPEELSILHEDSEGAVASDIEAADAEVSRVLEGLPFMGDDKGASASTTTTTTTASGTKKHDDGGESNKPSADKALTIDTTLKPADDAWSKLSGDNPLADTLAITNSIYSQFENGGGGGEGAEEEGNNDGSFWINDDAGLVDLQRKASRSKSASEFMLNGFGNDDDEHDDDDDDASADLRRRPGSSISNGKSSMPSTPKSNNATAVAWTAVNGQSNLRQRSGSSTTPRRPKTNGSRPGSARAAPAPPPHARPESVISNVSTGSMAARRRNAHSPYAPSTMSTGSGRGALASPSLRSEEGESSPMWASAPGPANAIKRNGSSHSSIRASSRHTRRPSASSSISSDSTTANYYQQHHQHSRVPSSPFDPPNYQRPLSAASSRSSGSTSLRSHARPGSSASNSAAYPASNPQWATPSPKQQRQDAAKLQRKRSASVSSQRSWQAYGDVPTGSSHIARTPSRTSTNGGGGSSLRDFEFPAKSPGRSHSSASGRSADASVRRTPGRKNSNTNDYDHYQQRTSTSTMVNVVSALNKARTASGRV
ncbi:hypothetical protein SYNPS1DRAFT_28349 [Syncephalis pseudoplumigaleata]|uniref:Uncharacterized protein n=1 Tax=Syncephalis pseudoplumigaleata TaxID=1712513 RepID=A0A4P9Z0F5_9FUNG|nr:hypothetical protein SYNPS1DRAFT_28349 [Syncephalis pseudoplumigaleata]|eukprot:RKP25937.1 hypothetical protein SYNPS1DRAFT_28349 [Syncephalis pseudoplumigaleata]